MSIIWFTSLVGRSFHFCFSFVTKVFRSMNIRCHHNLNTYKNISIFCLFFDLKNITLYSYSNYNPNTPYPYTPYPKTLNTLVNSFKSDYFNFYTMTLIYLCNVITFTYWYDVTFFFPVTFFLSRSLLITKIESVTALSILHHWYEPRLFTTFLYNPEPSALHWFRNSYNVLYLQTIYSELLSISLRQSSEL